MTVGITTGQWTNTGEVSTRPIRVVRFEHSGSLELISESGDIEFNGELFSAGGIKQITVEDGRRATLTLSGSTTRIAESVAGRWRTGKICQIYAVPGLPEDTGVYDLEDGVLLLDGIIDASDFSGGVVTVRAIHKHLRGNLTPRQTFNVYSQYLPAVGSLVEYDGESFLLRSRR